MILYGLCLTTMVFPTFHQAVNEMHNKLNELQIKQSPTVPPVIPEELKEEQVLIRFLRARKLDQVKALQMYLNWLRWREQVDYDHVLSKPKPFGGFM